MADVKLSRLSNGAITITRVGRDGSESTKSVSGGNYSIDWDEGVVAIPNYGSIRFGSGGDRLFNGETLLEGNNRAIAEVLATEIFFKASGTGSTSPVVLTNNTSLSHTGSTSETVLFTVLIPGGTLGLNGSIDFLSALKWTNNANTKTFRIRINGSECVRYNASTNQTIALSSSIANRNATNVQIMRGVSTSTANTGFGSASSGDVATYAFDTMQDLTITLTVTLANAADTASFEMFRAVVYK